MATTPTQDPVASESPRDLKYNAGKIDEFVTSLALKYADRFGGEHYTIEGLRQLAQQAIADFGWVPFGTFQEGAALTLPNQILKDEADGEYYRWDGNLPKVVPTGSTPESAGGVGIGSWVSVGDAALRNNLAYGDVSQNASPRENSKAIEDNVKGVLANPIIRFATFNIWTSGSVANYYGGNFNSKERLKDLKEAILKSQAAYIGMQECYVLYENPPEHFLIYPHKVSYFGKTNNLSLGRLYGNIFTTAFETSEKSSMVYSSGPGSVDTEYRGYTKSIMTINGMTISVYNTHLSTEDSRIVAMLTELKSIVSSDPSSKIVIMGDLNTQDLSLFKPFEDIGFSVVNKNDINTSVNGVWYIDNILHKGFSSQVSRGAQGNKVGLSDHKLLYVDLEL